MPYAIKDLDGMLTNQIYIYFYKYNNLNYSIIFLGNKS